MNTGFHRFIDAHRLDERATYLPAPCSSRHAALLVLAGISLRRPHAWHADHGTGKYVQLPFPG